MLISKFMILFGMICYCLITRSTYINRPIKKIHPQKQAIRISITISEFLLFLQELLDLWRKVVIPRIVFSFFEFST